jgi:hypothetical protein
MKRSTQGAWEIIIISLILLGLAIALAGECGLWLRALVRRFM